MKNFEDLSALSTKTSQHRSRGYQLKTSLWLLTTDNSQPSANGSRNFETENGNLSSFNQQNFQLLQQQRL